MQPNVSFNSLIVPPIIQCMKLKKMMSIKCDVKRDNIVKNNLTNLTSKSPILIK
jgi:hypothetical protein